MEFGNVARVDGLKVARIDVCASVLPLARSADIRICVPLRREDSFVASCEPPCKIRAVAVEAPEIWVLAPRQEGSLTCYGRASVVLMWVAEELFAREAAAIGVRGELLDDFVAVDPRMSRLARVIAAGFRVGRAPDRGYLNALARELVVHLAHTYARPDHEERTPGLSAERLDRVLRLVEERVTEPLRIEDLASHVHMSPFHFARMFKRSTGHAPHFYITMRRVERAKQLLSDSAMPLAEISATLGYATQAHFTGVFRQHAGATPNSYRRRFRGKAMPLPPPRHL
jgi:AraC family transcriptional regulator